MASNGDTILGMRRFTFGCIAVSLLLGGACAETPMAGRGLNSAAKRFDRPPMNRANIYVYQRRSDGDMELLLDGVHAANIVEHSFIVLPVWPGAHTLVARLKSAAPFGAKADELEVHPGGGLNYFVELTTPALGLVYREASMEQIDSKKGEADVRHCTLLAEVPPRLSPP